MKYIQAISIGMHKRLLDERKKTHCGAKVPVVWGFRPGAVRSGSGGTSRKSIWQCVIYQLGRHASWIIAENSEGTQREARITNAIPVAIVVSRRPPPSEPDTRVGVALKTPVDTEVEDGPHNLRLLLGGPVVIEPVVSDGKCGREFANIEEVLRVPVISLNTEVIRRVSGGVLSNECDGG
jgi:hypothetical protein